MNRSESIFLTGFVAAAILLAACAPAAAERSRLSDVVESEIEVRLAEVEVIVTDRDGAAVAGLAREDFEVLQDGQPVELTHFRAVTPPAPLGDADRQPASQPDDTAPEEPSTFGREPLSLIIYVDRGYLQLGDLAQIRDALRDFLRNSLGNGNRAMLVSAGTSLSLEQGLTTVPELVIAQLDQLRERPSGSRFAREYRSILQDLQRAKNEGNDLDARDPLHHARAHRARIEAFAAEATGEVRGTTSQLRQLIQLIAGLPGRRVVLYVGGRVPVVHASRLFDAWNEAFGRNSSLQIPDVPGANQAGGAGNGVSGAALQADNAVFDSMSGAGAGFEIDASRAVQEVAEMASAHGVVFHTLDASGLRGSSEVFAMSGEAALGARGTVANPSPTLTPGSAADSLGSLRNLALGTGGRAFWGSRNFEGALARLDNDLKTYYSLGFAPLPAKGGESRIDVRMLRRGDDGRKLVARHRPLLRLKDSDTLAAERTISALLLEDVDNPLEVVLVAGEPTASGRDVWRVPLSITVPLARLALVADGRVHAGRLSIFTTAGGIARVAPVTKAVVPVRIPNQDLLTSLGRRVAYELELELPSGRERIAVTVRDDFRPLSSTTVALPQLGVLGSSSAVAAAADSEGE